MSDVYTRTGDSGTTSLADGSRVRKSDPRIELFGTLDEANCLVGLARVNVVDSELDEILEFVQHRLFNCAACLAGAAAGAALPRVTSDDTASLEAAIDRYDARIAGPKGFTLPGCDEASGRLHVARAVMRRAERAAVALAASEPVDSDVLAFLNRASDLLYIAARYTSAGNECAWRPDMEPPSH
jgi:cob(I)alamin adenosyltransferase